jgi:hypothetical protein
VAGSYRLTPEARANLDDICAFIAEDNSMRPCASLEAFERLNANKGRPDIRMSIMVTQLRDVVQSRDHPGLAICR